MPYENYQTVPPLTRVTKLIITICTVCFGIQFTVHALGPQWLDIAIIKYLSLIPFLVWTKYWIWQPFTYMFLHDPTGAFHLVFNMLALWFFGSDIEIRMGQRSFLTYYLVCGVGGGLIQCLVAFACKTSLEPVMGSSGAIYGILAAFAILFGNRPVLAMMIFPMKAKHFVLIVAGIELISGVRATPGDNVAHFAHLGGMVVGALYLFIKYGRPFGGGRASKKDLERERLKKQFTLIVNEGNHKNGGGEKPKDPYWN